MKTYNTLVKCIHVCTMHIRKKLVTSEDFKVEIWTNDLLAIPLKSNKTCLF